MPPLVCPLCASDHLTFQWSAPARMARCLACSTRWLCDAVPAGPELYSQNYYDRHYAPLTEALRNFFSKTLSALSPASAPGRVLDVGFGSGLFLEVAAARGWQTSGVEVSPAAYDLARQRLGSKARLLLGDPLAQTLEARSFDLVCFWDSLAHVGAPRQFLIWAQKLVKPGGRMLIKTPVRSAGFYRGLSFIPPRLRLSLLRWPTQRTHLTLEGLSQALIRLGGRIEESKVQAEPAAVRGGFKDFWRHPRGALYQACDRIYTKCFPVKSGMIVARF